MADPNDDLADRLAAAAVDLAAEGGWRRLSLPRVAEKAGASLAELYRRYPTKVHLLAGFSRMVDRAMLEEPVAEADSPRDRLFDLLMRRFDVLAAHRPGLLAVLRDLGRDPASALCHGLRLEFSMRWALEAAGIGTAGPLGRLRTKALAVIYLLGLRAWRDDDSVDMARTMKTLDTRLRQAEQLANSFGRGRRAETPPAAEDAQ